MRFANPARTAALTLLPALAGAAGVAVADAPPVTLPPSTTPHVLPPTALGDLQAVLRERRAERRRREARLERSLARRMRFPVAGGPPDYGGPEARFGNHRGSHVHEGQDIFAPAGTALRAITDATVLETGGGDARGNYVALYDRRRDRTYAYFHMQAPSPLRPGQRVRAGRLVGRVGCTGRCSGDHLHFEVHVGRSAEGRAVDPLGLLRRARRAARRA